MAGLPGNAVSQPSGGGRCEADGSFGLIPSIAKIPEITCKWRRGIFGLFSVSWQKVCDERVLTAGAPEKAKPPVATDGVRCFLMTIYCLDAEWATMRP